MVNRSIVLMALGCFFAGAIFTLLLSGGGPPPSLTDDLDPEWRKATVQFDTRLRERFPAGTTIASLARELQEQGFEPTWYEVGGEYGAVRQEGNFPARWRLASTGNLVRTARSRPSAAFTARKGVSDA
ncbi:hypothetical protein FHT02_004411 [Sphingomonas xinjiangensis]|uniref:Uncharacterized protein n=1 Tax=Sphingomonas xinjiangensis TaxID=643568 RepID=A0A840YU20_9SPHN|nr:hypothetical protein [Sphingomonas xinjiangensis]